MRAFASILHHSFMQERLIELLTRKFANEATEEELDELDELLAKNPDAIVTEEFFREIWSSQVQKEDVGVFYKRHKRKYREEFESMDEDELVIRQTTNRKQKKHLLSMLAAAILSVAACLFVYINKNIDASPAYTQVISGKGIRKSIKLPDGTKVWLNAESKLTFDANINASHERLVTLSGEAFFDVAHFQGKAFIIHTGRVSVKVLGTAFNVKAFPNDKRCETTLIRGSVEVSLNGVPKQKFILKPAEKFTLIEVPAKAAGRGASDSSIVLIENITPVKVANKAYVRETSWAENKLVFANESLQELAPKLERRFDVKIKITGRAIFGYRFTGSFTSQTIDQALTAMKLIKPFNFTRHDKNVRIY